LHSKADEIAILI